MKRLILLPLLVLLFSAPFNTSDATVLLEDAQGDGAIGFNPFNEHVTFIGSGSPGDYVLLGCATTADGPNSFNEPAPGAWTELDNGDCGGSGRCIQGLWGKFQDTPNSELITCSWNDPQNVWAAGNFRYEGADPNNPIIDVACNTGTGNIATAPSIVTEALSQVARIYTGSRLTLVDPVNNTDSFIGGTFLGFAIFENFNIFMLGDTELAESAGDTGEATLNLSAVGEPPFIGPIDFSPADWRACTIGIRMQPKAIPTLSEWGFLAFAGFLGLAGIWFLRRRQAVKA